MLTSILLTLISEADAILPAHLGRANYAETLKRLGQVDAALAAAIHAGDGPKPLTCSGLWGGACHRESVTIRTGERYTVRMTGLSAGISQGLHSALVEDRPAIWTLHGHPFTVETAICDRAQDPWSGSTTYEELAAAQLLHGERPPRQVKLEFASPTAFKSAGLTVPVPMPNLVFGSLVERWNAFSPVTLSPEMRRFCEEMVALSRYRLESRVVEQKNNALRIGGVGQATYVAVGGDRYWLAVLQMLADFALYSGVGVQTATGMGQCRRVR
ncbi:MAG: CRISPR-associated protein Cas6 [Chloroflexi bacterium]|nr:MAG: CRISPR-associated protein Cas6 [Chloroflexota bacterium]